MNQDIGIDAGAGETNRVAAVPARPRRWWPWVLAVLGLGLLLMLGVAAALAGWLLTVVRPALDGVQVDLGGMGAHVEGLLRKLSLALTALAEALQEAWPWLATLDWHWHLDDLGFGGLTLGFLALLMGVVLAVLALVTLLPLLVAAVLAGGALAVLAALVLAAAVAALALSPLWLPALAAVWWWSRRTQVAAT